MDIQFEKVGKVSGVLTINMVKADYEANSDLYATVVNKNKETVTLEAGNTKIYQLKATAANNDKLSEALVANWIDKYKTNDNPYYTVFDEAKYSFVDNVPTENGSTVSISAMKVENITAGTYVIEYTANSPWTGAYRKIYKIVTIQ